MVPNALDVKALLIISLDFVFIQGTCTLTPKKISTCALVLGKPTIIKIQFCKTKWAVLIYFSENLSPHSLNDIDSIIKI